MFRNRKFEHGFTALLTGLLIVAVAAPAIAADREVNESGPASAEGMVLVENISGSVQVIGWNKNEISVTGTLSGDIKELEFEAGKKKTRIEGVWPRDKKNLKGEAHLVINVPSGSQLEVECVSADIEISEVNEISL